MKTDLFFVNRVTGFVKLIKNHEHGHFNIHELMVEWNKHYRDGKYVVCSLADSCLLNRYYV